MTGRVPAPQTHDCFLWAAGLSVGLVLIGLSCGTAHGQPRLDPTGRSGEPPPFQQEEPRPSPPPPTLTPLPPPPTREFEPLSRERVFVREIRVTGSTVFSAQEL